MTLVNIFLTVNNFNDRELLTKIYKNVHGSLNGTYCNGYSFMFDEQNDPFSKLSTSENIYPYNIYAKLNGQDTLQAISFKIKKNAPQRNLIKKKILDWVTIIDSIMDTEMKNEYHGNKSSAPPTYGTHEIECLDNMNELLWACRLSLHVTHVIPTKHGVYISNEHCSNMQWIALSTNYGAIFLNNFHFNKDVGFKAMISTNVDNENLHYLNDHFTTWKTNNYSGKLSNYFETEYPDMFENEIVTTADNFFHKNTVETNKLVNSLQPPKDNTYDALAIPLMSSLGASFGTMIGVAIGLCIYEYFTFRRRCYN